MSPNPDSHANQLSEFAHNLLSQTGAKALGVAQEEGLWKSSRTPPEEEGGGRDEDERGKRKRQPRSRKEVSVLQVHRTRSGGANKHFQMCNKTERPVRQPHDSRRKCQPAKLCENYYSSAKASLSSSAHLKRAITMQNCGQFDCSKKKKKRSVYRLQRKTGEVAHPRRQYLRTSTHM